MTRPRDDESVGGWLRAVDRLYLPRAGRVARRWASRLERVPDWRSRRRPRPRRRGPAPVVLRLRRVDDRFARRGPLALLRDVPQVGAVLIGVLVLASGVTVAQRITPATETAAEPVDGVAGPDDGVTEGGQIGPSIGDDVATYLADARRRLAQGAKAAPDREVLAVVSFDRYRTPADAASVVAGLDAVAAFYRVPVKGLATEMRQVDVRDVSHDLLRAFVTAKAELLQSARDHLEFAKTIDDDDPQKPVEELAGKTDQAEAAALGARCVCVFGVAVRAPLSRLLALVAVPGTRAVDPGPAVKDARDVTFRALLPEEKITVTGANETPRG